MKKLVFASVLAAVAVNGFALTHNLTFPWNNPPRCSPPQTPLFSFHNKENDTMLFTEGFFKGKSEIVIYCQAAVRSYDLSWTLHRNCFRTPFTEPAPAEALPGNLFRIVVPTKDLEPGFYDIRVKLACGFDEIKLFDPEKTVKPVGVCTFGWKVEDMPVPETKPADFKEFWAKALADCNKIPLDIREEGERRIFKGREIDEYNLASACLPGNFDPKGAKYDEVVSYKISWAGPDGGRVSAWVAHPNVEGRKFPALAVFPGAGDHDRPRPLDHARHGYFALDLNVHGVDVEAKAKPELAPKPKEKKPRKKPQDMTPQDSGWFHLYQRAYQAVEVIATFPQVDTTSIVAVGGSQGGRLSYVVSALNKRVVAAIPCIAHGANMPRMFWTHSMNGKKKSGKGELVPVGTSVGEKCEAYFDPMNFSPDVTCPVFANGGLIDTVSPAYATWSVFKRCGSRNKTFIPVAGHGHDWYAAFDKMAYAWLEGILK